MATPVPLSSTIPTDWTRYAFVLAGDEEAHAFGAVPPLATEITIHRDGKVNIHLGTDFSRHGAPVHLSEEQLSELVQKLDDIKGSHRG